MKYKSKLKRNSKYNPHSKRFANHILIENNDIDNCLKKRMFLTINKAKKAKRQMEKGGCIMDIYKCPHCKHYHLTSIERRI